METRNCTEFLCVYAIHMVPKYLVKLIKGVQINERRINDTFTNGIRGNRLAASQKVESYVIYRICKILKYVHYSVIIHFDCHVRLNVVVVSS